MRLKRDWKEPKCIRLRLKRELLSIDRGRKKRKRREKKKNEKKRLLYRRRGRGRLILQETGNERRGTLKSKFDSLMHRQEHKS